MENQIIKTTSQQLAPNTYNVLLTVTNSPADLLKCEPIALQIKKHGRKPLIATVIEWLNSLANGLDINLPPERAIMIASDLIEVYTFDSLEDLREVLKKARQGVYGWGMEKRGVLNMIIIREWMAEHLERKAIEREKASEAAKDKTRPILEAVDYEAYKIRDAQEKKEGKTMSDKDAEYSQFKAQFIRDNKK